MFDYIIVGAGSAGCVLANRLTEDLNTTVLLLEAGGHDDHPKIHTPSTWPELWQTEVDWAYHTEPQVHLNGRTINWPRGKVLGGSSSINALIYTRGHAYDYDHWARLGNEGWSYADVLPYFMKSENQGRGVSEYHGVGGPLNVADLIEPHPIGLALVEAAKEVGIPPNDDFNGARQEGVGMNQVTQRDGKRHSTAAAFLKPAMQRANLSVKTHAQVTHVLMEDRHVMGVAYVQDGERYETRVNKEVILCGGAINSPQILLLSGIGPSNHLQELGITVIVDLPGVGQNLQDHLLFNIRYLATRNDSILNSSNLAEAECFISTRPGLPAPDLQISFAVNYLRDGAGKVTDSVVFDLLTAGLRPESRGSLTLASNDPFAAPIIDPNYLDSETDMQVLADGFKIARKIGQAKALDGFRGIELQPGEWLQTDEAIRAYVRETCQSAFHPVGTCKMGHDRMAVVNDQLQVHGVHRLRVVDASIIPTIVSRTNAPTIMIAEKAADLIKQA